MLPAAELTVNWLDQKAPAVKAGASFGVPFKKGVWRRADSLAVKGAAGAAVPAQTWPLAVWPDGSVKWLGVALSGGPELAGPLQLGKGVAALPAVPMKATQDAGGVSIDTGVLQCRVAASGDRFIESMTIDGRVVARDGQLVAMSEDRTNQVATGVVREERFVSVVGRVTLEPVKPQINSIFF